MLKTRLSLTLAIALTIVASSPIVALSQEKQLKGGVNMVVDPSMRIDRGNLRRSAGTDFSDFKARLAPQLGQLAPFLDSRAFVGFVNQTPAPMLKTTATKTATQDKDAPYIWYQSAMGGYYDASGTTKELVRADRLHLFGGKFEDGTKVPKTQIRDYNAMGHAFRQQRLNTAHFWDH
jgi:hypothetical protein